MTNQQTTGRRGGRRPGAGRRFAPLVDPELAARLTPGALHRLEMAVLDDLFRAAMRGNSSAAKRYLAKAPEGR